MFVSYFMYNKEFWRVKIKEKIKSFCSSQNVGKPNWGFLKENFGNLLAYILDELSSHLFSTYHLPVYCWNKTLVSLFRGACSIGWIPLYKNLINLMDKFTVALTRFKGIQTSILQKLLTMSY